MLRSLFLLLLCLGAFYRVFSNCTAPALLSATAVTDTGATLTWTDVSDNYEIELRLAGQSFTGVATHVVPGDPPFVVSGLLAGRQYRFRVRALCAGGGNSIWSATRLFSTSLNNETPCPLDLPLRDTSCASGGQLINWKVSNAPGMALGTDVLLKGVRLVLSHPWRSDLQGWLRSPDGQRIQIIGGLNAGDQNLGNPAGNNGCGQFIELCDAPTAPLLSTAAEQDNITGFWRSLQPLAGFHNGQNPNGNWTLEWCDNKLNHTGRILLAQLIFERVDCPAGPAVQVSSVTLNSVQLTWDTTGLGIDSVRLSYGPKGFLPETAGTVVYPNSNPFTINGLNALQAYDVSLSYRCGAAGWSAYSPPASFFTVCPVQLAETFDTLGICPTGCTDPCPLPNTWQNISGDDYDWKVRSGPGITYPNAGPAAAAGGSGNYLFFRNSCSPSGANGKKALLRTLCLAIEAPPGPPCHFSMDLYMHTSLGQMGTLRLEGSTDGGVSWQPIRSWTGNQGKAWKREFIDLSAYHQQTAIFQLSATGVFGAYGDIAVDNLFFYGATPAGAPDFTFYRDADGDGFGNAAVFIKSCSPVIPAGFIDNNLDCNDGSASTYPGAPEIICNGIDENCNGNADDTSIPPPTVAAPAAVCEATDVLLSIQNPNPTGAYYWFDQPDSSNPIGQGSQWSLQNMQTSVTLWVSDSVAAGGCSSVRVPISIQVEPKPDLVTGSQEISLCQGEALILNELNINDLQNLAGQVSFHFGLPATFTNQIQTTAISPVGDTTLYVLKTSAAGCTDLLAIPLVVYSLPAVTILNGAQISVCAGKTTLLQAQSSTAVQYAWSNGLNFNPVSVTHQTAGTAVYTVTVTNAEGCTATDQVAVNTLSGVSQANIGAIQHVSFCGGNDGSIAVQALNGLAPYTFSWTGPNASMGSIGGVGAGGGSITGLTQGGYRITITDATGSGCSMVLPSQVINAPGLTVASPQITQPLCPEGRGTIQIVANGTAPTYSWSHGPFTTATVQDLLSGVYTVTVTDGACTQVIPDMSITAPAPLAVVNNGITDVDCFGNQNGRIDIAVSGGAPGYTFLWNDGATDEDRTGLGPGSYRVTVTDARFCTTVSDLFTVQTPEAIQLNAQITPVSCAGLQDGAITATVSGGVAPWVLEWSNGPFTASNDQLFGGAYQLTVTDQMGCTRSATWQVPQPTVMQLFEMYRTDPTCTGVNDGYIGTIFIGGTPPYQYQWSNGQTTASLTNVGEGSYDLQVIDANHCHFTLGEIFLTAQSELRFQVDSIRDVPCFGGADGLLHLSVNGAVGPLVVTTNGIPTDLTQEQLAAGNYQVIAQDARGCQVAGAFYIAQPEAPLQVTLTALNDIPCAGEPSGSIFTETAGGTPPYQYLWSNGATSPSLTDVPAGIYAMSVTDARHCQAGIVGLALEQPAPMQLLSEVSNIPCFGPSTGALAIAVVGGMAPYAYQWSNGATTEAIFGLEAGEYQVSVFDHLGCFAFLENLKVVEKATDFQVYFTQNQPVSCNGGNDGRLEVSVINGKAPYQFAWSAPIGLHANINNPSDQAEGLSGGLYNVTVTDADGCFLEAGQVLLEESPPVAIQLQGVEAVICKGASTGGISTGATGGVPPLTFEWSNGAAGPTIDQLPAGIYHLTVTDFRGCTAVSLPIEVAEPALPLVILTDGFQEDVCSNGQGAITTQVNGGTPIYQYHWSNGAQTPDITQLWAGNYTLTVTDNSGCSVTQAWTLAPQAPAMQLAAFSVGNVSCKGDGNGFIATGVSGGNLPLQYFWSNGDQSPNIFQLEPGVYQVTVQDQAGCVAVFQFPPVEEPELPLSVTYQSFPIGTGYTIALNVSGGTPGYFAQWDSQAGNQTGLVVNGLAAGNYQVTVTDMADCSSVIVVQAGLSPVNELERTGNIKVFPNPFGEQLILQSEDPLEKIEHVTVRVADGRVWLAEEGILQNRYIWQTNSIPPGFYWLEIITDQGRRYTVRVIHK